MVADLVPMMVAAAVEVRSSMPLDPTMHRKLHMAATEDMEATEDMAVALASAVEMAATSLPWLPLQMSIVDTEAHDLSYQRPHSSSLHRR